MSVGNRKISLKYLNIFNLINLALKPDKNMNEFLNSFFRRGTSASETEGTIANNFTKQMQKKFS